MLPDLAVRIELMALALSAMLLYFLVNRGHARYYFATPLDRRIPFVPLFIVPYLSFIPLLIAALLLALPTSVASQFYLAVIVGALAASFTRFFVHGGIRQPEVRRRDGYDRLVRWLYRNDPRARTFPSTHVLISFIVSYYLALAFPPYAAFIWLIGVTIAVSTLFVKQHYLFDVVGGVAFAVAAIYAASVLLPMI